MKSSTPASGSRARAVPKGLRTAEEELRHLVDAAVNPRHRHAILHRLGWSGQPIPTLARLGEDLALSRLPKEVSRERMRQIQERAIAQMGERFRGARAPKISAALRVVVASVPIAEDAIPARLRQRGIAEATLTFDALVWAARVLALPFPVRRVQMGAATIVAAESKVALCRAVYREIASTRGIVRLAALAGAVGASPDEVRNLIKALASCGWLGRGLFWRLPRKPTGNKVIFVCAKLFSTVVSTTSRPYRKILTIEEIMSSLARCRTVGPVPPQGMVLTMLRQTGWFVVDPGPDGKANHVRLAKGARFHALGSQDIRLIRAARGLGKVLGFTALRDGLVAQGMSANHANVVIQTSPFLFRIGKGRYRLLADPNGVLAGTR